MYYQIYEWNHAFLSPTRAINDVVRLYYKNPLNPLAHTDFGRQVVAAGDVFERMTRRYGKPEFEIDETVVDGRTVQVSEQIVWERPFCRLVHFAKSLPEGAPKQPRIVIVAPMSGHYATLLHGTVEALLPDNDVYITDWIDARMVPLAMGSFDLDDYIDYIIDIVKVFGGDTHIVAVCQPAVPVFAATALLEQADARALPKSITLMGGPIDTRQNPTEVNLYAAKHDLDWFRRNVIMTVPFPYAGFMRRVYPGFLQLTGFMTMNLDRHVTAHYDYFDHLVNGDGDSADKHREFYDEYMSVMDLTEEFYLQTVDTVFLQQALPMGTMTHRGNPVNPAAITRTPIFTVEGEKDDISGLGQTKAAHTLTPNLAAERHQHYEQASVGHYGVFNGSRYRREIAPRITAFVAQWDDRSAPAARPSPIPAKPEAVAPAGDVAAKPSAPAQTNGSTVMTAPPAPNTAPAPDTAAVPDKAPEPAPTPPPSKAADALPEPAAAPSKASGAQPKAANINGAANLVKTPAPPASAAAPQSSAAATHGSGQAAQPAPAAKAKRAPRKRAAKPSASTTATATASSAKPKTASAAKPSAKPTAAED
ncbi:MAG: polyhydroxyalkanoate depolymerase, partial [Pseudomonadota bacterium]